MDRHAMIMSVLGADGLKSAQSMLKKTSVTSVELEATGQVDADAARHNRQTKRQVKIRFRGAASAEPANESEGKRVPNVQVPHEIEVCTHWAALLDAEPPPPALQRVGAHEVWLLTLFSTGECERLLAAAESHGFGRTNYPQAYRGNLRLSTTDPGFAALVWSRLQAHLPSEVTIGDSSDGQPWQASGLNDCWRLAKYHPGDRFMGHVDGAYTRQQNVEMSMFTVNVYMNEGFEGGSTRFYFDNHKQSDFAVTPRTGLCLLFRQPPGQMYYHDGEQLGSGLKYLFRSDVMYRKQES